MHYQLRERRCIYLIYRFMSSPYFLRGEPAPTCEASSGDREGLKKLKADMNLELFRQKAF
jgi:hypothetical protein